MMLQVRVLSATPCGGSSTGRAQAAKNVSSLWKCGRVAEGNGPENRSGDEPPWVQILPLPPPPRANVGGKMDARLATYCFDTLLV